LRVLIFEEGKIREAEAPDPVPGEGAALVRVRMVGVCNTDLELLSGYYGFSGIAGHEVVGEVIRCDARPDLLGKRAVVAINQGCGAGDCPFCASGVPGHCPDRQVLGIVDWSGAFAEYLVAPVDNLHWVPDGLGDLAAVFAEPLAAVLHITEQAPLGPGTSVAVLGDGKLGMLAAWALSRFAPDLTLLGKHEERIALAASLGLSAMASSECLSAAGRGGRKFDVVVEATGSPLGLAQALEIVRPLGIIVMKTTTRHPVSTDLARLVVNEVRLVGSRCGDMGRALGFLAETGMDTRPFIEAVTPFSCHAAAFERAVRPGAGKVILEFP